MLNSLNDYKQPINSQRRDEATSGGALEQTQHHFQVKGREEKDNVPLAQSFQQEFYPLGFSQPLPDVVSLCARLSLLCLMIRRCQATRTIPSTPWDCGLPKHPTTSTLKSVSTVSFWSQLSCSLPLFWEKGVGWMLLRDKTKWNLWICSSFEGLVSEAEGNKFYLVLTYS